MEVIDEQINERNNIIKDAKEYSLNLDFKCTVLLIGSYARGDFNLWSDVDLLIIADFHGNPLQRLKYIDFPSGYETILLTPGEVEIMKNKKNKFILDAFKEGIILRNDLHVQ